MDLATRLTLLLLGLASLASGQFKHSKRRPLQNKPLFNFPSPKSAPLHSAPLRSAPPQFTQQPPAPQESSIEVQRAEVHSEEFIPNQEQREFPGQFHFQGFGAGAEFRDEHQQRRDEHQQLRDEHQQRRDEHQQRRDEHQQLRDQQRRDQPQQRQSFRQLPGPTTLQPREQATPIPIIRLEKQQSLDGSYKSNYETGNSIHAEETGFLKNAGKGEDQEALVQFGSYSYTDPDGRLVEVSYTADEGGFRATGSHLPTPPPVPPEVQRGLDIIFESIRREAELEAKQKKKLKRVVEPENYPVGFQEEVESQARPPTHQKSSQSTKQGRTEARTQARH